MIRLEDLQDAIAECQGERNPDARTCIKLAAYYILKDHLYPDPPQAGITENYEELSRNYDLGYSTGGATEVAIPSRPGYNYNSDTEFYRIAADVDQDSLMAVMDELMSVLEATNPRLYRAAINKLLDT